MCTNYFYSQITKKKEQYSVELNLFMILASTASIDKNASQNHIVNSIKMPFPEVMNKLIHLSRKRK